ncbi:TRAP-type mannitol/chloroaromatic compound transport system substrate-binding protein [Sinorhizobium fredii]
MKQGTRNRGKTSRRQFLSGAAMAGAAAVAAPSVVKAQGPTNMRWQSTWPSKDIFHEFAIDFAKKVNDMTGGDLKIEVLPAGAVVPAFGLLDAVSQGTLDGGHGVVAYHYGKQSALALWGSGPGFAMDANMLLAWHKYGGGKDLLAKLYESIGANVVSFLYGPMPTQPLGWFKKPVAKVEDIQGLKFRTVGISIDVFTGLGAAVNALPGGEIVAALDRGLLDAAEFNNASSDRVLGFPDVSKICMLQSYHQNAEQFEILFNKARYDQLPEQMKAIISNAAEAASQDMHWKAIDRYSRDYVAMQTSDQVKFYKTPESDPQETARGLRRGGEKESCREPAVQGGHSIPDRLCRARDAVGTGYPRRPAAGVRPLFRERGGGEVALTFSPFTRHRAMPVTRDRSMGHSGGRAWTFSIFSSASTRSACGSARPPHG